MKMKLPMIISIITVVIISINLYSCNVFKNDDKNIGEIEYSIPKLNLNSFSESRKDILVDYLSQSSEWHVFPLYKTIIAKKRSANSKCEPTTEFSPESYAPNGIPSLTGQFFNLYPNIFTIPETHPATKNRVSENSKITLKVDRYYEKDRSQKLRLINIISDLAVESENKQLSINSVEESKDNRRLITTEFLLSTGQELKRLDNATRKEKQITDVSILPPGSTIISAHPIVSIKKLGMAYYVVSGYVNPGKKGLIYLRVVDKEKQAIANSQEMESTKVEYVGWSKDINRKFYFCLGTIPFALDRKSRTFLGDFQVWFKPSDGSPDKILYKQSLSIEGDLGR